MNTLNKKTIEKKPTKKVVSKDNKIAVQVKKESKPIIQKTTAKSKSIVKSSVVNKKVPVKKESIKIPLVADAILQNVNTNVDSMDSINPVNDIWQKDSSIYDLNKQLINSALNIQELIKLGNIVPRIYMNYWYTNMKVIASFTKLPLFNKNEENQKQ